MFKGASASVKTEQLTSQAPCSYITRSIFLPHSFCLYFFSPPLSTSISSISSSLPRVLVPLLFCFGFKNRLFTEPPSLLLFPLSHLKLPGCVFFFYPAKYLLAWKKINWMGHTLVSPLYLFSWFSPFYLPSQVKRKRIPPISKLKAVCSHCFFMFS